MHSNADTQEEHKAYTMSSGDYLQRKTLCSRLVPRLYISAKLIRSILAQDQPIVL